MKIAIDTNRYSDLGRQVPEVMRTIESAEAIFIPFIVVAELRYGFIKGTRRVENEALLDRFIRETGAEVLWPDESTVEIFASLKLKLRKQGTPIPDHDIWIAAVVIQNGLALYDRDSHFDHLPQVMRV